MNYTKLLFETFNDLLKSKDLTLTYNASIDASLTARKIDLSNFKYNLNPNQEQRGFDLVSLKGDTLITIDYSSYHLRKNSYDTERLIRLLLNLARAIVLDAVLIKSKVFKLDDNFFLISKHRWSDTRYELNRINTINNANDKEGYRLILTNTDSIDLNNSVLKYENTALDHLDRLIPIYTKPFDLAEIDHFNVADADKNAVFVMRSGRTYGKFYVDATEVQWFSRCQVSGYLTTSLANYFNERITTGGFSFNPIVITHIVDTTFPKCADCDKKDLSIINKDTPSINIKFRGGCNLCDACAKDVEGKGIELTTYTAGKYNVGGYSSNPTSLKFEKFDSESMPLYMGIELEVDTTTRNTNDMDDEEYDEDEQNYDTHEHNYNSNFALHLMSGGKDTIFTKTDGSLHNGFEIVSHPMTLAKHLRTMKWQKGMEYLTKMGYKSHNTSTCGLHIHINRNFFGGKSVQGINGAKIAYLMENNRQDIIKFTRRRSEELDRWARFGDMARRLSQYATPRTKSMLSTSFRYQYNSRNKYVALNTIHANTFEFRIFKGTLNFGTLVASMQLVDNLARIVKDIPNNDTMFEALDKIKFDDIVNYRPYAELTAYWEKRKAV